MVFGVALLLAVMVPLAATVIGVERARRSPTTPATVGHQAATERPRTQLRDPFGAGLTTGLLLGLLSPVGAGSLGDAPWVAFVPAVVLVLLPLAIYAASRRRLRYALGMAAGAGLITVAMPLVLIALVAATGLVAGWFS